DAHFIDADLREFPEFHDRKPAERALPDGASLLGGQNPLNQGKSAAAIVESDPVREGKTRRISRVQPYAKGVPLRTVISQGRLGKMRLDRLRFVQGADPGVAGNNAQTKGSVRIHIEEIGIISRLVRRQNFLYPHIPIVLKHRGRVRMMPVEGLRLHRNLVETV